MPKFLRFKLYTKEREKSRRVRSLKQHLLLSEMKQQRRGQTVGKFSVQHCWLCNSCLHYEIPGQTNASFKVIFQKHPRKKTEKFMAEP